MLAAVYYSGTGRSASRSLCGHYTDIDHFPLSASGQDPYALISPKT